MKKRSLPYHLWGKMWGKIYDDLISLFSFFIRRGCTSSTSFAVSSLSSAPDARPTSTRWAQFLPLKKSIFAVGARKEPVFHPCPEIEVVQTFKANLVTVSFVSFVIGICDCSFCFRVLKFQIQSMVLQL